MVDVNSVAHTSLLYIYDSLSLHSFSVVVKKILQVPQCQYLLWIIFDLDLQGE